MLLIFGLMPTRWAPVTCDKNGIKISLTSIFYTVLNKDFVYDVVRRKKNTFMQREWLNFFFFLALFSYSTICSAIFKILLLFNFVYRLFTSFEIEDHGRKFCISFEGNFAWMSESKSRLSRQQRIAKYTMGSNSGCLEKLRGNNQWPKSQ